MSPGGCAGGKVVMGQAGLQGHLPNRHGGGRFQLTAVGGGRAAGVLAPGQDGPPHAHTAAHSRPLGCGRHFRAGTAGSAQHSTVWTLTLCTARAACPTAPPPPPCAGCPAAGPLTPAAACPRRHYSGAGHRRAGPLCPPPCLATAPAARLAAAGRPAPPAPRCVCAGAAQQLTWQPPWPPGLPAT